MGDKYLIDKASLVALADITRAYNQTPEKEYTLAEVTEQAKSASETLHDMFNAGVTELKSEAATAISGDYAFSSISNEAGPYVNIWLPNVTEIAQYALRKNYLGKVYMPNLKKINTQAFYQCYVYRSVFFPAIEEIGQFVFGNCYVYAPMYFPKLNSLNSRALSIMSGATGYIIFQTLPILSGNPAQSSTSKWRIFVKAGMYAEMETATNWGNVVNYSEVREATTYEEDFEDVWKMLVEDGHLTEEEIRRDFYAES